MSPLMSIALDAAHKAAEAISKGMNTSYKIQTKSTPQDLVTEYDTLAEKIIIDTIKEKFPSHHFLGEESGYTGSESKEYPVLWIIDPIDGTMNFAHRFPWFAINMAAVVYGKVEIALTFNPIANELFTAIRGQGTFLNGTQVHVSKTPSLPQSLLSASFPYGVNELRDRAIRQFAQIATQGNPIRLMGSAALSLAYVAAGKIEAHWGYSLKPWDLAPGMLLIEEAGGKISSLNGSPVIPTDTSDVLASNGILHKIIYDHLK